MGTLKPGLIIGGASKSGTTALYYYLRQHPALCLPEKKELHFFSRPWLEQAVSAPGGKYVLLEVPKTFEEFLSNFSACEAGKTAVDISPSYLYYFKSADRIREYLGDVRIVFILRNPADKAFSQYLHLRGAGLETLDFGEALAAEPARTANGYSDIWLYRKSGFYADAIRYYIKVFGRENIHIIFYDDFAREPERVLRDICIFAGIDREFRFAPVTQVNRSGLPRSRLVTKLIEPNFLTYILRRVIPQSIGRLVRKFVKELNTGEKPVFDKQLRSSLIGEYARDIQEVEQLAGRKSGWLS